MDEVWVDLNLDSILSIFSSRIEEVWLSNSFKILMIWKNINWINLENCWRNEFENVALIIFKFCIKYYSWYVILDKIRCVQNSCDNFSFSNNKENDGAPFYKLRHCENIKMCGMWVRAYIKSIKNEIAFHYNDFV